MHENCLFCKIVRKDINTKEVLRDEHVVAFHDLNPQAPTHVLVIPTVHAEHLSEFAKQGNDAVAGRLLAAAAEIGTNFGPGGYRVVINEGPDAGQSVFHLHAHVLAGRPMAWPPWLALPPAGPPPLFTPSASFFVTPSVVEGQPQSTSLGGGPSTSSG